MTESANNQLPSQRIYIGKGMAEVPDPAETKADTLYNKKMQEIFDVVAPESVAERVDAAKAQAEIAVASAEELQKKNTSYEHFKEHKDTKRFLKDLDREWRGRELPQRLQRVMYMSVLGTASAAMDYVGDFAAEKFLEHRKSFDLPGGKFHIEFTDENKNREALKAGWEMLTDIGVGAFSDKSVQLTTNRENVEFISPLSKSMSKIGSIVSMYAMNEKRRGLKRMVNAVINPSTIEAGLRSIETIPVGGALVERLHRYLNNKLDNDYSFLTVGFDVSTAMLAAKIKPTAKAVKEAR